MDVMKPNLKLSILLKMEQRVDILNFNPKTAATAKRSLEGFQETGIWWLKTWLIENSVFKRFTCTVLCNYYVDGQHFKFASTSQLQVSLFYGSLCQFFSIQYVRRKEGFSFPFLFMQDDHWYITPQCQPTRGTRPFFPSHRLPWP